MKRLTKVINLIICLSFSILLFGSSSVNNTRPQTGFMLNINELKEISDVMDYITVRFVGTGKSITEVEKTKLMQGALKGMIDSLGDPHSTYFTKKEMETFMNDLNGTYGGVGMVVQKKKDEPLLVVSPVEDSPAYKAGIKPQDKILAIDDKTTYNMSTEESVNLLRGTPNTSVKVTVYRESTKETMDLSLIRSRIALKYVKHKMIENEDGIGYLRLTQFGDNIYDDMAKAMDEFTAKNIKGLILDLRGNPGGSLQQAIRVASMFIPEGKIVSTRSRDGKEEIGMRYGKYYGDMPLVVLIDQGSASASEIVAGAIKDHKRGILIGDKTFGKGSVQTLINLPNGDGIKLTIAKYYTPSDVCIHGIGIEPDIKIEDKNESFLLSSMGAITNIDEKKLQENRDKLLKEMNDEAKVKELMEHKDIQLERAVQEIKKEIENRAKKSA